MTEASKGDKRKISLGFREPEVLEGDTIYVDFRYNQSHKQVSAKAYSTQEFISHTSSLDGHIITQTKRRATTYTGGRDSSWELDYQEFIRDLVESNNGEVEQTRLIEDGARVVTNMLSAKERLEAMALGFSGMNITG